MTPALLPHRLEGAGEPVLLLNGGLMTLAGWETLAAPLRARFRVLRCDFRGQLLSPGEAPPTLEGHAADVVALLDGLGLEAAHVVGTSFGALVGTILAARWPARVRSLVLATATERLGEGGEEGRAFCAAAARQAAAGGDRAAAYDVLTSVAFSPAYREAHAAELAARRGQMHLLPSAWFNGAADLLDALAGLDLRPLLPRVACPTLVIAAELDETFDLSRSRALAQGIPGARLEVVPGSGHALVLERPGAFQALVERFLDEQRRT